MCTGHSGIKNSDVFTPFCTVQIKWNMHPFLPTCNKANEHGINGFGVAVGEVLSDVNVSTLL